MEKRNPTKSPGSGSETLAERHVKEFIISPNLPEWKNGKKTGFAHGTYIRR